MRMQVINGRLLAERTCFPSQSLPSNCLTADGKCLALLWCIMLETGLQAPNQKNVGIWIQGRPVSVWTHPASTLPG